MFSLSQKLLFFNHNRYLCYHANHHYHHMTLNAINALPTTFCGSKWLISTTFVATLTHSMHKLFQSFFVSRIHFLSRCWY